MGLKPPVIAVLLYALPAALAADEVVLRSGGRVRGVIVERSADRIVIETGPGRVTLPTSLVEKVVESRSALEVYQERAASLSPGDGVGWADLARWAAERDLLTQAREAWQRVLALDPSHPEANAALGRVEVDGAWMTAEEGYRARGLVPFEGRWVSPAEHEALVRERLAEEVFDRERRAADLRVREAEARAREAEARAREAEAAAQPVDDGGIPLWWGGGGGYLPLPVDAPPCGPDCGPEPTPRGDHHAPASTPHHPPPTSQHPSSIGPAPSHASSPRSAGIGPPPPRPPTRQDLSSHLGK
jgi:hypothetical protein